MVFPEIQVSLINIICEYEWPREYQASEGMVVPIFHKNFDKDGKASLLEKQW